MYLYIHPGYILGTHHLPDQYWRTAAAAAAADRLWGFENGRFWPVLLLTPFIINYPGTRMASREASRCIPEPLAFIGNSPRCGTD